MPNGRALDVLAGEGHRLHLAAREHRRLIRVVGRRLAAALTVGQHGEGARRARELDTQDPAVAAHRTPPPVLILAEVDDPKAPQAARAAPDRYRQPTDPDVESDTMSANHLPPGFRLEEYEIVRVLGAGGFGITYLAFDYQLDGPVALKEYFPHGHASRGSGRRVVAVSTESQEIFAWGLERFIEEARAIHRFRHLNVVRVNRYVQANGTAYIVMEYVEGESLAAVLEGPRAVAGC